MACSVWMLLSTPVGQGQLYVLAALAGARGVLLHLLPQGQEAGKRVVQEEEMQVRLLRHSIQGVHQRRFSFCLLLFVACWDMVSLLLSPRLD